LEINVRVHGRGIPGTARPRVVRKLRKSLGRLSGSIRSVDLLLRDVNGPKGGIDKVSRLAVTLGSRKAIRVEAAGRTVKESVDGVVRRAKHLVGQALLRRQEGRKEVGRRRPEALE
jgi:putative sigma-54 modulation protein